MYIVTRRYKLGKHSIKEAVKRTQEAFTPLLEKMEGFHDYYYLYSDGSVMVINIFESRAEAEESTRIAREWIKNNIPDLYAGPPEIFSGEVMLHLQKEGPVGQRSVSSHSEQAHV